MSDSELKQDGNLGLLIDNFKNTLNTVQQKVASLEPLVANNIPRMASLAIDPLKYLSRLPDFNGEYSKLQNIIDLVDRIHARLITYDEPSQLICSDIIKSKLTGRAREMIEINCEVTSWAEMKRLLSHYFGDRKSVDQLFDELRGVTFRTNSLDMYNEIKTILWRLNTKTKNENQLGNLEQTLKSNTKSALEIFKRKLPEPMKSILYCRDPTDLETAINILHESGHAYFSPYSQNQRTHNTRHNQGRNKNSEISNEQSRYNRFTRNKYSTHPQTGPLPNNYNTRDSNVANSQPTNRNNPNTPFTNRYNPNPQRQFYSTRYYNPNNQYSSYNNRNNVRYHNFNTTNQYPHRNDHNNPNDNSNNK